MNITKNGSVMLLALVLSVASYGPVLADEDRSVSNASSTKSEKVKNLKGDEKKADIQNKISKKLDKERKKIANAFENAIRNLKSLADRVEARIIKLETKGRDMSSQKVLLTDARAKITLAETELATLLNVFASTTVSTSTRKSILKETKVQSEKTKVAIKTAHKAIVNVIRSLKPGREEDERDEKETTATSTENTSTSTPTLATTTATTTATSSNQ